ncbi:hypothetical protein [Prochlorothrix hollandica]|uniref:SH3b domain-containing protein n=1 Tax=Prochlorothrix hollandica PCC 9006 = CALU 1027 TaxID=317619 RepID=A0A0M2PUP1_PROHO|nr:hypothetical protein [Prochlorothrix hollandica]KKI98373.1 hypothetical protein PROH_19685 [Prochlorothrix hollandica PCC 9006 = CALU 1027]
MHHQATHSNPTSGQIQPDPRSRNLKPHVLAQPIPLLTTILSLVLGTEVQASVALNASLGQPSQTVAAAGINPDAMDPAMDPARVNPAMVNPVRHLSPGLVAQGPIALPPCYIAVHQVGVYQEPNRLSPAHGILRPGDRLLVGSGSTYGWLRITAPWVGWLEASAVQPGDPQRCTQALPQSPGPVMPPGTIIPGSPVVSQPSAGLGSTAPLCQVIDPAGLPIRNQPILHDRTLLSILPPGLQPVQFSDRQFTETDPTEQRHWVYVTAPQTGWVLAKIQRPNQPQQLFIRGTTCTLP